VFAILIWGIAYAIWPPEFFHDSLDDLTTVTWFRAAASLVLAFAGLEFAGALAIVMLSDI
jgi:hypothetical protein